ncbi:MAG: homocysteine S-methyltransferase family protein [Aeromicrobium sp.]|uniref:homocysteine S-methyltransferase family protein n=1 Tax=Aeromicrobium sp. TaxID=1871063 RepID=UPI003C556AAC
MVASHPLLTEPGYVTDGGLETDLVFHHDFDLPEFAAFPLLTDERGRAVLDGYYDSYVDMAHRAGLGVMLETPTWRANQDWGTRVGYDAPALDQANRHAVDLVRQAARRSPLTPALISGIVGPRGDGYVVAERPTVDEAAAYHSAQVASLTAAGVDLVHAMTITTPEEAMGVVTAARSAGIPVAISFTVEVDGRLPDGAPLGESIEAVDEMASPDWFGINCSHPTHIATALDGGGWQERVVSLRPNASTMSHAELDAMEVLDPGDLGLLTASFHDIRAQFPNLSIVGGCCGTSAGHVAALWNL